MKTLSIRTHLFPASCALMAIFATTSARATILAIDFNNSTSPTESGFIGQFTSGITHSTGAGDITVSFSGQQGVFDRGAPPTAGSNTDFYRDFIFDNNSAGFTITLSDAGIAANTDYIMTFWAFDDSEIRDTTVAGTAGTSGPQLSGFGYSTADPTSLSDYRLSATYTSDGSGNLTFLVNSDVNGPGGSRSSINGFQIAAVPESSAALLCALGSIILIRRRRQA